MALRTMKPQQTSQALELPALSEGFLRYARALIGTALKRSLNNDFVVAGISTSIVTGIAFGLKYLLKLFKDQFWLSVSRLYVTVEIEHSGLYRAVALWLNDCGALDAAPRYKALPKRAGAPDVDAVTNGAKGGGGKGKAWGAPQPVKTYSLNPADVDVSFLPMAGQEVYRTKFEGRSLWITLTAGNEWGPRRAGQDQERIRIQAIGPNSRDLIRRFLVRVQTEQVRASANHLDLWTCLRAKHDVEWELTTAITKRAPSTVVLDDGIMQDILGDVEMFIKREAWYAARSIPHRRGYLLEGPPGCGKTSLIRAVASQFNLALCCLQLKSNRIGEAGIESLLHKAPEGAIIVLEDVDCAQHGSATSRSGEDKTVQNNPESVTMSELLNAIDGLGAQTGRLVFMTTNHAERLDDALIRDGRIDRRFHIGLAKKEMVERIYLSICGEDPPSEANAEQAARFAEVLGEGLGMAAIQGFLVKHHGKTFDELLALARVAAAAVAEQTVVEKTVVSKEAAADEVESSGGEGSSTESLLCVQGSSVAAAMCDRALESSDVGDKPMSGVPHNDDMEAVARGMWPGDHEEQAQRVEKKAGGRFRGHNGKGKGMRSEGKASSPYGVVLGH